MNNETLVDKMAKAIADSISPDEENPGIRLWDHLDFSGENKARMICHAAAQAVLPVIREAMLSDDVAEAAYESWHGRGPTGMEGYADMYVALEASLDSAGVQP